MLILDTHVLLWLSAGDLSLGPNAREAIREAAREQVAYFSAISIWEVAILVKKRRYRLAIPVEHWRAELLVMGLNEAPLDGAAAQWASQFEDLHDDPADRFIAAAALRLRATLATADRPLLMWAERSQLVRALDARR